MAHWSTLLPDIWVCMLYWFPHRGKKERNKGALFTKVLFVLIVHKKRSASRKKSPAKGFTITASFARKESRVRNAWAWTCVKSVFGILVLCPVCASAMQLRRWPSQTRLEMTAPIPRPSCPVWLRPAGSPCGWWAAGGPRCWRPSPPVGEGRRRRRAGTDTWTDGKSVI